MNQGVGCVVVREGFVGAGLRHEIVQIPADLDALVVVAREVAADDEVLGWRIGAPGVGERCVVGTAVEAVGDAAADLAIAGMRIGGGQEVAGAMMRCPTMRSYRRLERAHYRGTSGQSVPSCSIYSTNPVDPQHALAALSHVSLTQAIWQLHSTTESNSQPNTQQLSHDVPLHRLAADGCRRGTDYRNPHRRRYNAGCGSGI